MLALMVKYAIGVVKGELTLRRAKLFFGHFFHQFLEVYAQIKTIYETKQKIEKAQTEGPLVWEKAAAALSVELKKFSAEIDDLLKENPLNVTGKYKLDRFIFTHKEAVYWRHGNQYYENIMGHNEEVYGAGYLESLRIVTLEEGEGNFVKLQKARPITKEDPYVFQATNRNLHTIAKYITDARKAEYTASGIVGMVLAQILSIN